MSEKGRKEEQRRGSKERTQRTMAKDFTPRMLAGFKLQTVMSVRPCTVHHSAGLLENHSLGKQAEEEASLHWSIDM